MKKIIFILIIIHCSVFIANAQWIQYPISPNHINSFVVSGSNIFAGASGGVYLSTDNGIVWTRIFYTNNYSPVYSLLINANNILAGTSQWGVYLSSNNGANWIPTSLDSITIWSLAAGNSNVYAGTSNSGIYRSTDNGTNWAQTSLNNMTILSLIINGTNIFAGTNFYGLYFSSNNGSIWTQTSLVNKTVWSLAISGSYFYAGTNLGVYVSTDNGTNWMQTSTSSYGILSLAVSGSNVLAGTWGFGAYLSKNNGTTWLEKNEGFPMTLPSIGSLLILNNNIFAGTYDKGIWRRSLSEIIGIQNISSELPSSFSLYQNYPNPFNPTTKIKFQIKKEFRSQESEVKLIIYDILGKEIDILINEKLQPGTYEVTFDGSNLPSGIYFYQLRAGDFLDTKKMLLIK